MLWKILADAVMIAHLLLMAFLVASAVLLALGFFRRRRNWQFFYYGVIVVAIGIRLAQWRGMLTSCSLTEWEYALRRLYDPTESWIRTRSLLGTLIYNISGIDVPEFVFTISLGLVIAVMIGSLVYWRDGEQ